LSATAEAIVGSLFRTAAGIEDEEHGLFGSIAAVPEPGTLSMESAGVLLLLAAAKRRREIR
jgi:hypothetical protein